MEATVWNMEPPVAAQQRRMPLASLPLRRLMDRAVDEQQPFVAHDEG